MGKGKTSYLGLSNLGEFGEKISMEKSAWILVRGVSEKRNTLRFMDKDGRIAPSADKFNVTPWNAGAKVRSRAFPPFERSDGKIGRIDGWKEALLPAKSVRAFHQATRIYSERRNGLTKYHRANEFPPHTRRATKNLGGLRSA